MSPHGGAYTRTITTHKYRPLIALALALPLVFTGSSRLGANPPRQITASATSLNEAQRLFYVGRYEEAAAMALALRSANPEDLATYELRTSALHFQIKRLIGDPKDRERALKQCGPCPALIADMAADTLRGQTIGRQRLLQEPGHIQTLFFLGKIDLNHVWLHLGTLGHRTGWTEYREARRTIEAVLKAQPDHVRARIAHAWIEYIVDTRVPLGLKWALGGGSKTRALDTARQAAAVEGGDFYARTEAGFALWEMLVKEKRVAEAVVVARGLHHDFPENRELVRFLEQNGSVQARGRQ